MSHAIDIVLSKAHLRIAVEQLKTITDKVKEKQPTHEWIEKNDNCIQDLNEVYYFLVTCDKELSDWKRDSFNKYKLILEQQREIDELKKQLIEIKQLL
jgi:hypothetical protein